MSAVMWLMPGDHPEVMFCLPQLIFSSEGTHFYVSHPSLKASEWLPVDPDAPGQEGRIIPFAEGILHAGDSVPVTGNLDEEDEELVQMQLEHLGLDWPDLRLFGLLPSQQGVQWVCSGDWILTRNGQHTVIRDENARIVQ